ncbi:MAG: glycyl-radical enzyme activating protein [Clostridia bacterium]|nr:glycyl-radical enzyme activating protein [Clostridia bacterium]
MEKGIVFSIEEFSVYDGPGIRTTVFLKGCPLHCMWCHSPEGQSFAPEMIRSPNGCLHCDACIKKGIELTGQPQIVKESAAVCPRNLIRQAGDEYSVEELVVKLKKNAAILNASGGGVTFSGGEPLRQPRFLNACLKALDGVMHRAIQTSGFSSPRIFSEIMKNSDYFLFDLKLMDPNKHLYYCGQSNAVILENYRILAASGKEFITRIPVIPTVNDTEENLTATAAFMKENQVKKVELLPYHKLTGSKYAMTGRKYAPEFDETIPPQLHPEIFENYGIEVNVL